MGKSNKKIRFDDLQLESLVLEFRYSIAYLFWDFAGRIWQQIEHGLPNKPFALNSASPANVSATFDDRYEIQVGSERFSVSCADSKMEFSEFLAIAKTVYDIVVNKLALESFDRVGFREIFVKKYESIDKVIDALQTLPSIMVPAALRDAFEGTAVGPGITLRVEDESRGTFFNLHGVGRKFDVKLPPLVAGEEEPLHRVYDQALLTLDIDSYTKTAVTVGQFGLNDWTTQAHAMAKRNGAHFF